MKNIIGYLLLLGMFLQSGKLHADVHGPLPHMQPGTVCNQLLLMSIEAWTFIRDTGPLIVAGDLMTPAMINEHVLTRDYVHGFSRLQKWGSDATLRYYSLKYPGEKLAHLNFDVQLYDTAGELATYAAGSVLLLDSKYLVVRVLSPSTRAEALAP